MERFLSTDPNVVREISEHGGYDYIVVGSGFGGGILADELADRGKRVLLIERGPLTFTTHVCNTARPDFTLQRAWVQLADGSEPYVGGPLYCLGGRSVVWGLWIPPANADTLNTHFPQMVAQDLQCSYLKKAFHLVTNGSQDPDAPYPEGIANSASIKTAKSQVGEAVGPYNASPVSLGPTATQFQAQVYRFPQGAYSTVERLLNRVYARDPSLTILMNAEVLGVGHVPIGKDSAGNEIWSVPALTVRLAGGDTTMKISANGAQVILAAGTLCTAQIALNSSLQRYNPLVGKGLMDHAVYATRFAMERRSGDPSAPLLLQTMIHINDTTALLTVTINNNFFLAGSSNVPIHQYLSTEEVNPKEPRSCPKEFHLIEMEHGEKKFKAHAEKFDTIAVLIEYGAPLDNNNSVVNSSAPHPVIRLRRKHTYNDEESLINMQILTTRIRNAVAKDIMTTREDDVILSSATEALSTVYFYYGQDVSHSPQSLSTVRPCEKIIDGGCDKRPGGKGPFGKDPFGKGPLGKGPFGKGPFGKDDFESLRQRMVAIAAELAPRPELLGCGIFAHETGTMRMGSTRDTSVVDENLKVHGFSNLHVCDLSVFPYSVEANPSITLAALSLRLADHLSKYCRLDS